MKNILFICTGNSARSIMAEAYMNAAAAGRWRAWSAGSKPAGEPNPFALETLAVCGISAQGARSKNWDEFAGGDAPLMNMIVTVCDNAAGETCPLLPKAGDVGPERLHWSFPDPASIVGDENVKRAAFKSVFDAIRARIDGFLADRKV